MCENSRREKIGVMLGVEESVQVDRCLFGHGLSQVLGQTQQAEESRVVLLNLILRLELALEVGQTLAQAAANEFRVVLAGGAVVCFETLKDDLAHLRVLCEGRQSAEC